MGSFIEFNDTLQITTSQGFPEHILNLATHTKNPIQLSNLPNTIFNFKEKINARVYHPSPTRCFLVHNIEGKWLYWGKLLMIEQTIKRTSTDKHETSGIYEIIEIYEPTYQIQITNHESPNGLSYFQ
ncbi:MAG: hypothetical protein UV82_C0008G0047 [Candidatus Magasanikbacteria bacterium GW2011_GWD2_43_18]|nr:MAG: hypothetical protein UV18_C0002G0030 [Candidatus Magasanikbacteria bacterium GW2011_GWC2_42_27]KKT04443.1 MAG: hypothetical protein UV82_C0008G0047 [Candidatus Magasanikbacteria bacterium GW2011_GWD2_43_18]KKT26046.1 MAG: hypothetical protein UW10_C0002G0046 [Candidatus Magasanikbacteria bacterium GW2011_GWA2_43_9]HBB37670.1 hypothetical protein [Candidatus Magasanikbacteria bacterium]HCC13667.1 hypothetical protein [Candidatus Magasanikbacteria bacterium]